MYPNDPASVLKYEKTLSNIQEVTPTPAESSPSPPGDDEIQTPLALGDFDE